MKVVATNRRAYYDYEIISKHEAGLVLKGWEVKSIRNNNVNLANSYLTFKNNELFTVNVKIKQYMGVTFEEERSRKVLLHKRELLRFKKEVEAKNLTLIPLKIYFTKKSLIKLQIGLAKGKTNYDKRQTLREKEWKKEKEKIVKR